MTRYLVLAAAALVLSMAAPAAFATRVVFDPPSSNDTLPPTTAPQCTHDDPCSIGLLDHTYQVNFIPCGDVQGVDTSGFSFCLWMNNVTMHAASKFTFQFIVPEGGMTK